MIRLTNYLTLPMVLVLLGGILSAVGAFVATMRQNQEKAQSASQRAEFEKDLRQKSEEIAELNKQIAANVTGGDSYCYLFVSQPGEKSNSSGLILMNEGKYPVYDISVKIDDVEHLVEIAKNELMNSEEATSWTQTTALLSRASKVFRPGNLGPNQATELGELQLPTGDKQSYNIYIIARNSYVVQTIRFRRINGTWKRAEKIQVNGKVLRETIQPDFPLNEKGQVQW